MIKIDVNTSFDKLALNLRMFSRDLPYATSQALNSVAFESQKTIRTKTLPGTFTLRNKRTQQGFQVDKATKDHLTATVGSLDWWTAEQVEGANRRAGNEGRESVKVNGKPYLAIPVVGAGSKVLPKKQRASALIAQGKAFVVPLKSGLYAVAAEVIGQRDIQVLFILKPMIHVKERLHPQQTINTVIQKVFDGKLEAEFERIARKAGAS
ncbi:hypothetical protein FAZ95_13870 [Trinickia violacea]|uniref:Uncharacterized protein n=1 Tax=Trinickia violacea TaxID=2571746 RepID=A0A4P8IPV8_9BURK|nr:hypothetical protein [Trinickia violacea]QCP50171.1 hypothetical protein FAZ95_13870 [Trinickia violacea]